MKRLVLFFLAVSSAFGALTVSQGTYDNLSHSGVRITYGWSGPNPENYRVRICMQSNPCSGMSGGRVLYNSDTGNDGHGNFNPLAYHNPNYQIIEGLAPNTAYTAYPEITDTANLSVWYQGPGINFTTLPLPGVHPVLPVAPEVVDTTMPDTSTYATETADCTTSDLHDKIIAALNNQVSQGTVIKVSHTSTCIPLHINAPSNDVKFFDPANVYVNTDATRPNQINVPSHGFTEGQKIVFGTGYNKLPWSIDGVCPELVPPAGDGLGADGNAGTYFYAHKIDNDYFQVYCNAPAGSGGHLMTFGDGGSDFTGLNRFEVAGYPRPLNWIIVETDTPANQFTPLGTRTGPQWANKMPKFVMPSSQIEDNGNNVLLSFGDTDSNLKYLTSHIRFIGFELTTEDYAKAHTAGDPLYWHALVTMGPWVSNIILDRIYLHIPEQNRVHRGIFWNGSYVAMIDSYFDGMVYSTPDRSGFGLNAPGGTTSFYIDPGTFKASKDAVGTLPARINVSVSGTGSGRIFAYFDSANSFAFTFKTPPNITLTCTGEPCVQVPYDGTGNDGSCWWSDNWPKDVNSGGVTSEVTVLPVSCIDVSSGLLSNAVSGPSNDSLHNTEGSNFMIGGLGPGPYKFEGNYSSGAGLTWHHDESGYDYRQRGDYTYERNYFDQPWKYMFGNPQSDGLHYRVRQPLEWKGGNRRLIKGNIFNNGWVENNPASATIAFTAVIGMGIRDSEIDDNTFRHVPGLISFGTTENSQGFVAPPNVRLRVYNNLAYDINSGSPVTPGANGVVSCDSSYGPNYWVNDGFPCANGWTMQGPNNAEDVIETHNTYWGATGRDPAFGLMLENSTEGIQVTDNVLTVNSTNGHHGIYIDGTGLSQADTCSGKEAKDLMDCRYTSGFDAAGNPITSYRFDHNLLIGTGGVTQDQIIGTAQTPGWYYGLTNYAPSDMTLANIGVNKYVGPNATNNDFRFHWDSAYVSGGSLHGSDGKDVGANIDELEAAQGHVANFSVPQATLLSTSAVVAFYAPDSAGCSVDYDATDPTLITSFTRVADAGGDRSRTVSLTGLTSNTVYYYRVNCETEQPMGEFRTK